MVGFKLLMMSLDTKFERAAHYQAGKDVELQPSSRDMQETTAQQKTLGCLVRYGKNPDGDRPPPAQSPGLFP